jgi:hypothetical protein
MGDYYASSGVFLRPKLSAVTLPVGSSELSVDEFARFKARKDDSLTPYKYKPTF